MGLENNIKKHRQRLSLSQEMLGKEIGVGKSTICQYEKGKKVPTFKHLIELSMFFGINIQELLEEVSYEFGGILWGKLNHRNEICYLPRYKNVNRKLINEGSIPYVNKNLRSGLYIWYIPEEKEAYFGSNSIYLIAQSETVTEHDYILVKRDGDMYLDKITNHYRFEYDNRIVDKANSNINGILGRVVQVELNL